MTRHDADRDDAPGNAPESTPKNVPDDARLMALADGELPGAEAAAVARAIATDPDVARRFAVFVDTRARLAAAAAAQDDVPAALRARVADMIAAHAAAPAQATPAPAPPPPAPDETVLRPVFGQRTAPAWALPLAASLALAVGLGAGFMARGPGTGAPAAGFDSAAVQDALGRLATGDSAATAAGALRVVSSFRDSAGALCREAVLAPTQGEGALAVLCRAEDGGWRADLVLRQPAGPTDGAVSAASGLGVLDAFLADIGAGAPLDPGPEARALAE